MCGVSGCQVSHGGSLGVMCGLSVVDVGVIMSELVD